MQELSNRTDPGSARTELVGTKLISGALLSTEGIFVDAGGSGGSPRIRRMNKPSSSESSSGSEAPS